MIKTVCITLVLTIVLFSVCTLAKPGYAVDYYVSDKIFFFII